MSIVTITPRKRPKVFSYTRFSTAEQQHGRGKARQEQMAEEWCHENGHLLEPGGQLRDLGVSAYKGRNAEHGALAEFLR
jgi:DNA invertase Pin-like site-specific DNA recombinase